MPMVAEIAGKAYHARDWGAGGLTLHVGGPVLEVGQEVAMRLRFDLPEGCRTVELGGRVLRTEGRQARTFQFLGSGHHAELEEIARSWLTGGAGHVHGPSPPAASAMPALPDTTDPPAPSSAPRRASQPFGFQTQWAIGA